MCRNFPRVPALSQAVRTSNPVINISDSTTGAAVQRPSVDTMRSGDAIARGSLLRSSANAVATTRSVKPARKKAA
jgi:hypothetical protein